MRAHLDVAAPRGKLLQYIKLETESPKGMKWLVINPHALLYERCRRSHRFRQILHDACCGGAQKLTLLVYTDETTPGSALRPATDTSREIQAIYFSCRQLPSWYRSRRNGWMVFSVIRTADQHEVVGGLSGLMRTVFRMMFSKPVLTVDGPLGTYGIMLEMGPIVQDERAHKYLWGVKGSGGMKICHCCRNVIGTDRYRPDLDDGFVHYKRATSKDIQPQTSEQLWEMADDLAAKKGVVSNAEFERLEKAYGITYDPASLLLDVQLRAHVRPVEHTFFDFMHNLLASGGTCSYEINLFILKLEGAGVPRDAIDDYCSTLQYPRGSGKLPRHYFNQHVVDDSKKHTKGFANTTLAATHALYAYVVTVVKPSGAFPECVKSFEHLCAVLDICMSGDRAVGMVNELTRHIDAHQEWFLRAYDIEMVKPKFHYQIHVPLSIARWGAVLSCFAMERRHQIAKTVASYGRGAGWDEVVVRRCLADMFHEDDWEGVPEHLHRPQPVVAPGLREALFEVVGEIVPDTLVASARVHTTIGIISKSDLVIVHTGADHIVGQVLLCVQCARRASHTLACFLVVRVMDRVDDVRFAFSGRFRTCSTSAAVWNMKYFQRGNFVEPMFPQLPGLRVR